MTESEYNHCVNLYANNVYRFILKNLGHEADAKDVVQGAFEKMWVNRGKQKNKGEYDLEQFKFSFIGEIGLGQVKLYGSYSPRSIYERGLDMRPYTLGIRLSNW